MILTGLLVGLSLGFVMQRGRFCITGAFRDVWLTGSTRWLTAFAVVIATHAVGYLALTSLGVIDVAVEPLPLAAAVVGGLVFGIGIVLAGGCATGTYYRAGEGLVGSWFALGFFALTAAMMKFGPLAGFTTWAREQTVGATTVSNTLGLPDWALVGVLVAGTALAVRHHLRRDAARPAAASLPPRRRGVARVLTEMRWHPFATALVIAGIATVAWPLSIAAGRVGSLGITTPSAKSVEYLATGDLTLVDWSVLLVVGILLGSFLAARASGEFRVRVPDASTIHRAIGGGAAMGVGASLAGGCTVGHGMVATAQLSWEGWIATVMMFVGAGIAARVAVANRASQSAPVATDDTPATQVGERPAEGTDRPAPVLTPIS
ncbi:YeeE/YedE thiosulfate transporter family protein [Kytococcus sedentarius]|uniref:YeeE/YedE thiosulfate transporter family protein n=1 Tax=Kytococcus sedentarius TaxID=1276 RepID=UPI0035BBB933